MVRTASIIGSALVVMSMAAQAAAQTPEPSPPRPRDRGDLRHQIYVMEGALARAVLFGAQQVNREIRSVSPDLFQLSGDAQARGVYLDGYGIFFDVGVPILRQSMLWSFRQLAAPNPGLRRTIDYLKAQLPKETDVARRHELENAIAQLELQLGPPALSTAQRNAGTASSNNASPTVVAESVPGGQPSPSSQPAPASVPPATAERLAIRDPNRAYTESVQHALIDAMIDYAAPMVIGDEEWLTVAARDNEPRDSFAPQDPYEEVVTILLRIRGADLAAYRAGRIDRDDAKRRVQIREF